MTVVTLFWHLTSNYERCVKSASVFLMLIAGGLGLHLRRRECPQSVMNWKHNGDVVAVHTHIKFLNSDYIYLCHLILNMKVWDCVGNLFLVLIDLRKLVHVHEQSNFIDYATLHIRLPVIKNNIYWAYEESRGLISLRIFPQFVK
jgi:hypothetical protein